MRFLLALAALLPVVVGAMPVDYTPPLNGGAAVDTTVTASTITVTGNGVSCLAATVGGFNIDCNTAELEQTGAGGVDVTYGVVAATGIFTSTLTVQGNAFSVGVSTFVVSGGLVGIGTTNPATKLHLSTGTLTVDGTAATVTIADSANNPNLVLKEGSTPRAAIQTSGGLVYFDGSSGGGGFTWRSNAATRVMTIDINGNVGIGTTSPAVTLDVNGGGAIRGQLLVTSSATLAGTTDGLNAPAGNWGEFISTTPTANVTPAASTVFTSIATTTLSAGDWDVSGSVTLGEGGTLASSGFDICISLTANACDNSNQGRTGIEVTLVASTAQYAPTPTRRISVSATTAVYLTGMITYTVLGSTTWNVGSTLRARRMR